MDGNMRPLGLVIPQPVESDLSRLTAVVRLGYHLEPWVLQCLLCRYTPTWVVDEDLLKKVQEFFQEDVISRNNLLLQVSGMVTLL